MPTHICLVRSIVLWLGPERSRKGLDGLWGPRLAIGMNEAAFVDGISTVINERSVLHVR